MRKRREAGEDRRGEIVISYIVKSNVQSQLLYDHRGSGRHVLVSVSQEHFEAASSDLEQMSKMNWSEFGEQKVRGHCDLTKHTFDYRLSTDVHVSIGYKIMTVGHLVTKRGGVKLSVTS